MRPEKKAKPINPKCLRVDKAISFFKSTSNTEFSPAKNEVKMLKTAKADITAGKNEKNGLKRIIKYNPAVTKVLEWTNAEIGVGAAMAKGSQEENG